MPGPPDLWEVRRDWQMDYLLNTVGVAPEHYFLDYGCGPLRLGLPMIDYLDMGHYYGVDLDYRCIAAGINLLGDLRHKDPRLIHLPDVTMIRGSLQTGVRFDTAWAFSVIIHCSLWLTGEILRLMKVLVKPDGAFYSNVIVREDPALREEQVGSKWNGFPVVCSTFAQYDKLAKRYGFVLEDEGILTSTLDDESWPGTEEARMYKWTHEE